MATTEKKTPAQLRASAKQNADKARYLQDELDQNLMFAGAGAETTRKVEGRIEHFIKAAEADQRLAEQQETEATAPDGSGTFRTPQGDKITVLSRGQSYRDAITGGTGETLVAALPGQTDWELPSVGETLKNYLLGSESPQYSAAQSGGSQTAGGFLLSPAVSGEIIDKARAASAVFQAGARLVSMPTSELVMARIDTDPSISWVGENETLPQSQAVFGSINFRARKMGVIVPISIELLRDAANASSEIERLLTQAAAAELDRAALLGDGAGEEPVGLFNAAGVDENAVGGAVSFDDFLDSLQAIEAVNGMPTALIAPPAVKLALAKLKINSEANHYAPAPADLMQMQRLVSNKLASSQACIGDFQQMLIGVRSGVEVVATESASGANGTGFAKDQILLKLRWRGDIQFAQPSHFSKLTGIA